MSEKAIAKFVDDAAPRGSAAASPVEAAKDADVIVTMLPAGSCLLR